MRLAQFILLVSITACVSPPPQSNWMPALEPFDPEDGSWKKSESVLLVADCQLFNIYTEPQAQRNLSSKAMADSAIRPPQLNLFADEVLRWVLTEGAKDTEAVLHLGDAIDLACEGELRTFFDTMTASDKPWLLAPGNHDCFYFGNYDPVRDEGWQSACNESGEILRKDVFVRMYVASLLGQRGAGYDDLARSLGLHDVRDDDVLSLGNQLPLSFTWEAPHEDTFLESIAWNIDTKDPWRSFVVQRANIGTKDGLDCHAILLDSCQYYERPYMLPNAWASYPVHLNSGLSGEILADQLRVVRAWLEDADDDDAIYALMSHHPLNRISPKGRASIKWLWREHQMKVATYVSAHTHRGHFAYHRLSESWEGLEMNIGSTTDWPMEWRTLRYFAREGRKTSADFYVQSQLFTIGEELENDPGYFLPEWEIPVGAIDDYRQYARGAQSVGSLFDFFLAHHLTPPFATPRTPRPRGAAIETERLVKDGCLRTYQRMIELFPTAPDSETDWPDECASDAAVLERIDAAMSDEAELGEKIALLKQVSDFDRTRTTHDPSTGRITTDELNRFKVCQAVWASRFESTQGRRLTRSDQLVRVFAPRTYTDLEDDPLDEED